MKPRGERRPDRLGLRQKSVCDRIGRAMRADLRWSSIPEMVSERAAQLGASEAVVDGERRRSYADLLADFRRVTAGLMVRGVRRGHRDLGSQPLRVAGLRSRNRRRRCCRGAREHALQARRGPVHPRTQRRTRGLHPGKVPGCGLRGNALRPPMRASPARARRGLRPGLGRRPLARILPADRGIAGCGRNRRAHAPGPRRRRVRGDVHLWNDGKAEGRGDESPAEPAPAPPGASWARSRRRTAT